MSPAARSSAVDLLNARSLGSESFGDILEKEVVASEKSLANYVPTQASYAESVQAMKDFPDRAVPGGSAAININYRDPLWLEAIALRPDLVRRTLDVQAERCVRSAPVMAKVGLRFIQGG